MSDEDKEGFERILGLLGQSQRATTQQESPRDSSVHNASGPLLHAKSRASNVKVKKVPSVLAVALHHKTETANSFST